ncbi:hypothetical protein [Natrinema saccharevitans]|nr:hypothetical protein [Natrinema saccharevitans]
MTRSDSHRRQFLQRAGGVALTATGASAFATTASAQSDTDTETESPPQGILANGVAGGGIDQSVFMTSFLGSMLPATSPTPAAKTLADRMRNEFTANSDHWVDYGNWLISTRDDVEPLGTVTLGLDVVVSRFMWVEDERVETTIRAEYDDKAGQYTDLGWWIETPENPDYQAEIRDKAARNAADELQEFRRKFIDTEDGDDHRIPDKQYRSDIAGRYASYLRFGPDSKHILELLVGEIDNTSQ